MASSLPINYKYEYIDLAVGDTAYQYEINPFNHSLEFIEKRNLYFMNYKTLQDVSDNYLLVLSCKRR